MGAESSILENCEWGDEIPTGIDLDWCLQTATLQDESTVTVFKHKRKDRKEVDLLQRATKNLRTLRHPNLLRFISSGETSDKSYLVTEQVQPLKNTLPTLHPLEICVGLQSILEALHFLHDKVGVSHNNVCLSSVYVTPDGSWRLGGLEHSCKFQEATAEFLDRRRPFRNVDTITPEEKQRNVKVNVDLGYARDMFAFGVLAEELLPKLKDLGDLTKTFRLWIQDDCLNPDPSGRPQVQTLLNDNLFRHDFLEILQFLKTVTTKSEDEKKDYFSSLTGRLLALPEDLVAKRLTVPLLSRFVMLDENANKHMIPNLLTPYRDGYRRPSNMTGPSTPLLSAQNFKNYAIPELFRIFHVRDLHIRMVLLKYFYSYVDLFELDTLEDTIFPQLLLGLRDTDDQLVAASLRCLACLVPYLGGDIVIGGARKKFFIEGMPKFHQRQQIEEKKKEKKMTNVSGIIGKKMLLKDLAAFSSSNGNVVSRDKESVKETETRKEEREKRKEEARQRREERRKKLEEKRKNENNKKVELENSAELEQEKQNPQVVDSYATKVIEERKDEAQEEKSEWTDWDEDSGDVGGLKGSDTVVNDVMEDKVSDDSFDESVLSDEIENELAAMASTVPLSPRASQSESPLPKIDWSDAAQGDSVKPHEKTKGILKLGLSKSKKPEKESSSGQADWGETWDHIGSVIKPTGDASQSRTSSTNPKSGLQLSKKDATKTTIPKSQSNLGSEFEIKSIEMKSSQVKNDIDFFSDMMPDIPASHTDLLAQLTESGNRDSKPVSPKKTVPSVSFAVAAAQDTTEQADGSGWGNDDLDWGNDDF